MARSIATAELSSSSKESAAAKSLDNLPEYTFGIHRQLDGLPGGWQRFPGQYLLYASSGSMTLMVAERQWLLPPQRAAWVAADLEIQILAERPVVCSSVLFARGSVAPPPFGCRVFAVTPLAREMILYAMRWGMERDPDDPVAAQFFGTLASVCLELAAVSDQFWLPRARSAELGAAMAYIQNHLADRLLTEQIARELHLSARTLSRRFCSEAHISCRDYIQRARLLRAMEMLAQRDLPVVEVASEAGFSSLSAFTHAFRCFASETPSQYRRRFLPQ